MMDFSPLWQTMKEKNVSCYALINKHGFSRGLLDKLKHNRNVTLETVGKLCSILDCRIEDVVVFVKDTK
ncbi:MAG: helix-turn-helix transcriptional regulator [Acetatifactor sp.]|nr:helix-turn-helix transcriptional regulator [Acetatifactor sp.]